MDSNPSVGVDMKNSSESVKIIPRYSESLKRKVVEEIESGSLSVSEALDCYGIAHRRTVNRWRQKYGSGERRSQVVRVMMKSEQERIRELERALADSELERIAYKYYAEELEVEAAKSKKKPSTERLKKLAELKKKAGMA